MQERAEIGEIVEYQSWSDQFIKNMSAKEKAEYDKECQRLADAIRVLCPYGYCTIELDADTKEIIGGFGPMLCPCDHTRGWKAKYIEQMGKPHPPIKKKTGKVMRRRRELKKLQETLKYYEDALKGKS